MQLSQFIISILTQNEPNILGYTESSAFSAQDMIDDVYNTTPSVLY